MSRKLGIKLAILGVLCHIIYEICSSHDFYTIKVRGQGLGHSDPKIVRCNLQHQDA